MNPLEVHVGLKEDGIAKKKKKIKLNIKRTSSNYVKKKFDNLNFRFIIDIYICHWIYFHVPIKWVRHKVCDITLIVDQYVAQKKQPIFL